MFNIACVIGNGGMGDLITYIGMINYLATKYNSVIVACMKMYYVQFKYFFANPKIILYPINAYDNTTMEQFDHMMRINRMYDIYAFGHYGYKYVDYHKFRKILPNDKCVPVIYDYPISYYNDVNIPISYMKDYFTVSYTSDILELYQELNNKYPKYIVVHQIGSNQSFDIVKYNNLDLNKILTIDVNKNLYDKKHKYYKIAEKFVNIKSVIFYAKLVENASALYLIDSCIHALALVVNVDNASPKICYQRETRFTYGFNKFEYYLLENGIPRPLHKNS